MSRFNAVYGSEGGVLGMIADVIDVLDGVKYQAITTGTSATALAANFINAVYNFSGGSTYGLTTPTAAQIVAAIPNAEVGSYFRVRVYNANSGTVTMTAGTGVTFVGVSTVLTSKCQAWDYIVTNATAGSEAVIAIPHSFANA
jgi:hypothetical protein